MIDLIQGTSDTTRSHMAVQQNLEFSPSSLPANSEASLTADEENDREKAMIQKTAALLASLSDVILSPIKTHKVETNQESNVLCSTMEVSLLYTVFFEVHTHMVQEDQIIAKRTRSKYPLTDTALSTIEGSLLYLVDGHR